MKLKLLSSDFFYSPQFALKVIDRDPELPYPLHSHDFFELVIILSGKGEHFTTGNSFSLFPGNVFVVTPGMEHGYKNVENLHLYNILFSNKIFIDAFRVLLDVSLDFETMDRVKTIILQNPGVISINGLWGRNSGQYKFIEADIVIKAKNLEKAYAVSRKIENEIRAQVSHVDHILIHYMPRKKSTYVVTVPLNEDRQTLSEHFGGAPYFYIAKIHWYYMQKLQEPQYVHWQDLYHNSH